MANTTPIIKYLLSHQNHPICENDKIWNTSIPLSRECFSGEAPDKNNISIIYGEYFAAVRSFIEADRFKALTGAFSQMSGRESAAEDLKEISICLEKHGEYYHPARVAVSGADWKFLFVVNVAISEAGKACIQKDYANIRRLNRRFPFSFLPDVYCEGEVGIQKDKFKMRMFLGQWLNGYQEFHLTRSRNAALDELIVWDPVQGNYYLTEEQRQEVYRQAAMILTAYYNLETFDQVFNWHHAAGDFVIKAEHASGLIDVKLITIRKYAPLMQNVTANPETMFQALLLFLFNLSIRMPLDRLDGVGEMAWADDRAVKGTVKGFLDGLTLKAGFQIIPEEVPEFFRDYLNTLSAADILDLLHAIVDRFPPQSPELQLIKSHLSDHAVALHKNIAQFANGSKTHRNIS